jgi:hypothetical protein
MQGIAALLILKSGAMGFRCQCVVFMSRALFLLRLDSKFVAFSMLLARFSFLSGSNPSKAVPDIFTGYIRYIR